VSSAQIETLLLVSSRWAAYASTLLLLGVPGACLVRVLSSRRSLSSGEAELDRRVVTVGVWTARVSVIVLAWKLFAQTYSNFGLEEPVTWRLVGVVVTQTMWGSHLVEQAWTFAAVLIGFEAARVIPPLRWVVAPASAVAIAIVTPLTSHAANHGETLWRLHVVHLLGAGLWIGTLGIFVLTGVARWTSRLAAYSPVALVGAASVVASGGAMTWRHIQPWPEAWSTPFGQALAAKIAAVLLVMTIGAVNWRVLRRRVERSPEDPTAGARLTRAAVIETALGFGAVVGLTAILTGLAMPAH